MMILFLFFTVWANECVLEEQSLGTDFCHQQAEAALSSGPESLGVISEVTVNHCVSVYNEEDLCQACQCQQKREGSLAGRDGKSFQRDLENKGRKILRKQKGLYLYEQLLQTLLYIGTIRSFIHLDSFSNEMQGCTLGKIDSVLKDPTCHPDATTLSELFSDNMKDYKKHFGDITQIGELSGSDPKDMVRQFSQHLKEVGERIIRGDKGFNGSCLSMADVYHIKSAQFNKEFQSVAKLLHLIPLKSTEGEREAVLDGYADQLFSSSDPQIGELSDNFLLKEWFTKHPLYRLFENDPKRYGDFLSSLGDYHDKGIYQWQTNAGLTRTVAARLGEQCSSQMDLMKEVICSSDDAPPLSFEDTEFVDQLLRYEPMYALSAVCSNIKSGPSLFRHRWNSGEEEFSDQFQNLFFNDTVMGRKKCDQLAQHFPQGTTTIGLSELSELFDKHGCADKKNDPVCLTLQQFDRRSENNLTRHKEQRVAHKVKALMRDAPKETVKAFLAKAGGESASEEAINRAADESFVDYFLGGDSSQPLTALSGQTEGSPLGGELNQASPVGESTKSAEQIAESDGGEKMVTDGAQIPGGPVIEENTGGGQMHQTTTLPAPVVTQDAVDPAKDDMEGQMASAVQQYLKNTGQNRASVDDLYDDREIIGKTAVQQAEGQTITSPEESSAVAETQPSSAQNAVASSNVSVPVAVPRAMAPLAPPLPAEAAPVDFGDGSSSTGQIPTRGGPGVVDTGQSAAESTAGNLQEEVAQDAKRQLDRQRYASTGGTSLFKKAGVENGGGGGQTTGLLARILGGDEQSESQGEVAEEEDVVIDLDPKLVEADAYKDQDGEEILVLDQMPVIDIEDLLQQARPEYGRPFSLIFSTKRADVGKKQNKVVVRMVPVIERGKVKAYEPHLQEDSGKDAPTESWVYSLLKRIEQIRNNDMFDLLFRRPRR